MTQFTSETVTIKVVKTGTTGVCKSSYRVVGNSDVCEIGNSEITLSVDQECDEISLKLNVKASIISENEYINIEIHETICGGKRVPYSKLPKTCVIVKPNKHHVWFEEKLYEASTQETSVTIPLKRSAWLKDSKTYAWRVLDSSAVFKTGEVCFKSSDTVHLLIQLVGVEWPQRKSVLDVEIFKNETVIARTKLQVLDDFEAGFPIGM